ncbi:methyltransferase family protein [Propionivibrio sp.]|jgi:protein-S-isoprenylcysteine O-methyltransferase Ste14|uniref:methyltransferase family protein n=1 Tax=Propionivibrio sp. TaxID=2212460 RepID=UPI00272DFFA5|nr:isoprenylcysteine carboxylmethyltransferase family protein [Propionivibrio sp.]
MLEHTIPPPVVAGGIALAMWFVSPGSLLWSDMLRPRGFVALVLVIAGLVFDLLALLAFLRARTSINPLRPHRASVLITHGVYRLTRNPMYVGLLCYLTAWAVFLATPWALAGPCLFVVTMNRFQIAPEERVMREKFGKEFEDYAARVRRWL